MKKLIKNANKDGMTLIEIIVALTVFVIMADMLFSAILLTVNMTKQTLTINEYVNTQVNSVAAFQPSKYKRTLFEGATSTGAAPGTGNWQVTLRSAAATDPSDANRANWDVFGEIKCRAYTTTLNSRSNGTDLLANAEVGTNSWTGANFNSALSDEVLDYYNQQLDDYSNTFSISFIQAEEFAPWKDVTKRCWYSWIHLINQTTDAAGNPTDQISIKLESGSDCHFFPKNDVDKEESEYTPIVYSDSVSGYGFKFDYATSGIDTRLDVSITDLNDAFATPHSIEFDRSQLQSAADSNDGFIDIYITGGPGSYSISLTPPAAPSP